MYQEDFLLRQIRRMAEVLGRLARGERVPSVEVDAAARDAIGLDLDTVDRLPLQALLAMIVPGDDRSAERMRAVAHLLAATAPEGPAGDPRRDRARALLARADQATDAGLG